MKNPVWSCTLTARWFVQAVIKELVRGGALREARAIYLEARAAIMAKVPPTRAERGNFRNHPARRAHAAFSAASESRVSKGPLQHSGSLFHFSENTGAGCLNLCHAPHSQKAGPFSVARLKMDLPFHNRLAYNRVHKTSASPLHVPATAG